MQLPSPKSLPSITSRRLFPFICSSSSSGSSLETFDRSFTSSASPARNTTVERDETASDKSFIPFNPRREWVAATGRLFVVQLYSIISSLLGFGAGIFHSCPTHLDPLAFWNVFGFLSPTKWGKVGCFVRAVNRALRDRDVSSWISVFSRRWVLIKGGSTAASLGGSLPPCAPISGAHIWRHVQPIRHGTVWDETTCGSSCSLHSADCEHH